MATASEKKSLLASYVTGITDSAGERYVTILGYFWPELITALLVSSVLNLIDASMIGHLKSTSMYATLGVALTIVLFLNKMAEGLSVGTVILCGQYNGMRRFTDVGRAAMSAFWVTVLVGGLIAAALYFGAASLFAFLHVPHKMAHFGIAFMRLRVVSIFLFFVYMALVGFLRGTKNTRVPMIFFVVGAVVFVFFDYTLIFGHFGFPALGLMGSAIASIIQNAVMLVAALGYIFCDTQMRQYSIQAIRSFDAQAALDIFRLSSPVILDKALLAGAKIWLVRLIAPMGKVALASYSVIRDMEQFAFVPAIAFASVITLLVSNDYGSGNWPGIKSNVKKVLFLASGLVFTILLLFALFPEAVIGFFSVKSRVVFFAATAFPVVSVLVLFDLLQVVLAGALRGAANVRLVMVTRLLVCGLVFLPLSYWFSTLPISNILVKFILIYGCFYLSDGVMSMVYVWWFRRDSWRSTAVSYKGAVDATYNRERDTTPRQPSAH
ncbi:MAG: MATE family efflux transporter [Candidatus Dependentiae bacterium]|nr:MATE family efflux transporter [Candidatus Dependentiae bacterium]